MTTENLAEQVRQKLELETTNRHKKIGELHELNTKPLVDRLDGLEGSLETALRAEASFRDLNAGFLSSGTTSDCAEVKRMLAELSAKGAGEKQTVAEKEVWLTLRRSDTDLAAAIARQKTVAFDLDGHRTTIEMAKHKLTNLRVVLGLKTAQIQFLTETRA